MESNQTPSSPKFEYLNDWTMRRELAKDFRWFCAIYLSHYFKLSPAAFHQDLMNTLGNHDERMLEIIGFRGSAKSTFGSVALPLWAALEHPEKYGFIIPVSDTFVQAKTNMANIKNELDSNWLIKNDYGTMRSPTKVDDNPEPDLASDEEWQAQNILLENGVRIMARSRGQKLRGLRHRATRPKLIVADDVEDREWVKTRENRDKTDQWFRGEVIPSRDVKDGRVVCIGNWLHEDALMARLKKTGMFKVKEFPLIEGDMLMWPALYPTQDRLDKERMLMGETAWQREMLLRIVPEEGQVITPRDIHYYDGDPSGALEIMGHGIDLAISKKSTADYTTDVKGEVRYDGALARTRVFIRRNPLNARLNFLEIIQYGKAQNVGKTPHLFFVEDVAFQKAAIEELERNGLAVTPMKPTTDKRSRLIVVAPYIKNGTVLFPRTGCEDLLAQLFGFGVETHDDLVDGLTSLILGLVQSGLSFVPMVAADLPIGGRPPAPAKLPKDPLNAE